jgi:hypothetical protein
MFRFSALFPIQSVPDREMEGKSASGKARTETLLFAARNLARVFLFFELGSPQNTKVATPPQYCLGGHNLLIKSLQSRSAATNTPTMTTTFSSNARPDTGRREAGHTPAQVSSTSGLPGCAQPES